MPDIAARLMGRGRLFRLAVLAVLGAVAALGQAPTNLWWATVLALGVFFWLADAARDARASAFAAWCFGLGYFAISLRWIVEPFLVDVARHGWMAPFALVLMAAGGALFWALAGWIAGRFALRVTLGLPLALAGAELLRSLVFTGFPWALLGHVWIDTSVALWAAWGGPHLLTLVTVLTGWAVGLVLRGRWAVGLPVVLLVAGLAVFVPLPAPEASADGPVVRLVQPNIPQSQKWDPAFRQMTLDRLLRLSGEEARTDLVVWPETSVPYLLNFLEGELPLFSDAARGAPLVFGIQRRDDDFNYYNSMVVLSPGGDVSTIYDKQHLVPFGEYVPFSAVLGRILGGGLANDLLLGFTSGAVDGPVAIPGIGDALPLICYEGIFAEELRYGDARPRLLLLITNDAWFGQGAGPLQHLAQARLRAIEQGLPMVRVANTGVSAMIDARGQVTAMLPLGAEGALDAVLPPALAATPYTRWGDWPVILVLIVSLGLCFLRGRGDSD